MKPAETCQEICESLLGVSSVGVEIQICLSFLSLEYALLKQTSQMLLTMNHTYPPPFAFHDRFNYSRTGGLGKGSRCQMSEFEEVRLPCL